MNNKKLKNMKKTIFKALALFACTMSIASCTEEMEWKDSNVTAPSELLLPAEGKGVELQASATASVVFEWGSSYAEDGGAPSYEVVFSVDGNFDAPLYKVTSDLGGTLNKATILHKTLNSIAGMAGAGSGETVNLKWTVFAYRGLSKAQASHVNSITLTRFFGFDELPGSVYVMNSAEGHPVLAGSPENGAFEVFVKLKAGQGFTLNSKADGTGTSYCVRGDKIYEGNDGYKVDQDGVYRIYLDFNVASMSSIKKVDKVVLYFCPDNAETIELPYASDGIFSGTGVITWKQEGWGRDERYKFHMYYGDGSMIVWGTKNNTDGRPNVDGKVDDSNPYFFIAETPDNQWDQKWKFDTWTDNPDQKVKLSLVFNVANYTHRVERAE